VPGHTGIDGNETADQSARPGSSHPLAGPKPALSIYEEGGGCQEVNKGWISR